MSEQTCEGALAPYGGATAPHGAGWREAVADAVTRAWARFGTAPAGCGERCVNRTAATLAGLNDHTLADIGIHRSQIRSLARAISDRPQVDPRGSVS